jgi:hypothetical protein
MGEDHEDWMMFFKAIDTVVELCNKETGVDEDGTEQGPVEIYFIEESEGIATMRFAGSKLTVLEVAMVKLKTKATKHVHAWVKVHAEHNYLHHVRSRIIIYGMRKEVLRLQGGELPGITTCGYVVDAWDYLCRNKSIGIGLPNSIPEAKGQLAALNHLKDKVRQEIKTLSDEDKELLPPIMIADINRDIESVSWHPGVMWCGRSPTLTRKCKLFGFSVKDLDKEWYLQEFHRDIAHPELLSLVGRSPQLASVLGKTEIINFTGNAYPPHMIGSVVGPCLRKLAIYKKMVKEAQKAFDSVRGPMVPANGEWSVDVVLPRPFPAAEEAPRLCGGT